MFPVNILPNQESILKDHVNKIKQKALVTLLHKEGQIFYLLLKSDGEISSSRWWHREILNSLPPTDTTNLQLHKKTIPSGKKTRELNNYSTTKDKRATVRWVEAEISPKIPPPSVATIGRRLTNMEILPEE